MLVLGIETSCDESSAALVRDGTRLVSGVVSSQVDLHAAYGGVVPEIAARAHVESILPVVQQALAPVDELPDLIAVTAGPGLVGSLVVGVCTARALAWAWDVPLVAVNHVEAHIRAPVLEGCPMEYPLMALVVSGGHTLLAEVKGPDRMEIVGETLDDALGEAYDKVARQLGLGYPGGPVIDRLAESGDPHAIAFPRPMMNSGDFNFSLSGLKTSVIRYVKQKEDRGEPVSREDVAASFQAAALEPVVTKTVAAAVERGCSRVLTGGGVACNRALRAMLARACDSRGLELFCPGPELCTDNAAMVASLGFFLYRGGHRSGIDLDVCPNLKPWQRAGEDG